MPIVDSPETFAQNLRAQAIKDYVANGFIPIPCHNDRTPTNPRWQLTQYDPTTTLESIGNPRVYGLNLKGTPQYFVLDADPRNYPIINGAPQNQLLEFWNTLSLPSLSSIDTPIVKSGSGYHVYFRKPEDVHLKSRVPKFEAVEIKQNHYVVGVGSVHNKTNTLYELFRGSFDRIMDAPPSLLDYCKETLRLVKSAIPDECLDDPQAILNYTRYLRAADANERAYTIAVTARSYGLTKETGFRLAVEYTLPKWTEGTEADLRLRFDNAYEYAKGPQGEYHPLADFQDFDPSTIVLPPGALDEKPKTNKPKSKKSNKSKSAANLVSYFMAPEIDDTPNPLFDLVRFNLRSDRIEFAKPAPWNSNIQRPPKHWGDFDDLELQFYLSKNYKIEVSPAMCANAVTVAARRKAYDPIFEYLSAAGAAWDGVNRIERLFTTYAGAIPESEMQARYIHESARVFMIGAVARALNPGCQFDTVVVLEGEQGVGKSNFVKILGGPWYLDAHIDPKRLNDTVQALKGRWVCEISEMTPAKQDDQEALKAFLSRKEDVVRFAYGRHINESERSAVFVGTTNQTYYHKDTTGNRRYLSIATGVFDLPGLIRDRDQLFGEAYVRFTRGEEWHISNKEIVEFSRGEQNARKEVDPWQAMIADWLESGGDEIFGLPENLRSQDIANYLGVPFSRQTQSTSKRIANAMRSLGYIEKPFREYYKDAPHKVWRKKDECLNASTVMQQLNGEKSETN